MFDLCDSLKIIYLASQYTLHPYQVRGINYLSQTFEVQQLEHTLTIQLSLGPPPLLSISLSSPCPLFPSPSSLSPGCPTLWLISSAHPAVSVEAAAAAAFAGGFSASAVAAAALVRKQLHATLSSAWPIFKLSTLHPSPSPLHPP